LAADREHTVARVVFVVSVVVTIALYAIPELRLVAYPLLLLSTLAHEMGHGLAALLSGGRFLSFELYSDASGIAQTATGSSLSAAVVAAGGLIGPAIAAALSFFAGRRTGTARAFLASLCLGLLVALVLVVRNTFGWVFVGMFAALLGVLVFKASPRVSQIVLVFLGTQLGLSVFSRGDYLFTSTARMSTGTSRSDVAVMADALLLPYWFWGLACGAASIVALFIGARSLWRKP
jgi:Peptidase M50B-like